MKHYETLGVARDATQEQIRAAYRAKASAAHPDKGGSVEAMQAINTAYHVLSDPGLRALYDQTQDGMPARPPEVDAREVLMELFGQAVSIELSPVEIDSVVRNTLIQMKERTRANVLPQERRKERLERLLGAITTDEGVENIAALAIQKALDATLDEVALLKHAEKVAAAGLVLLDAHKFAAPAVVTPTALLGSWTTYTSS